MAVIDSLSIPRESRVLTESVFVFGGWTLGTFLASLLLWVLIPTVVLDWRPMAITSGSMSPLIRSGDVVLVDPDSGPPVEGSVVAFDSAGSTLVHRVMEAHADGTLTTKGDANTNHDSTRVGPEEVIGTGRLLVPLIGLIRVVGWGWSTAVIASSVLAAALWRSTPGWSASMTVLVVAIAGIAVANAAFAATTTNNGSSLAAVDTEPPTELVAACGLIGGGNVNVDLSWTASATTDVTGYRVFHDGPSEGTNWTEVGTIGASDTDFTHQIPTELVNVGTHTYSVQASLGPWDSENSDTDAVSVTQVLLVYACTEL